MNVKVQRIYYKKKFVRESRKLKLIDFSPFLGRSVASNFESIG